MLIRNKSGIGFDTVIYALYCAILPLNMILNFTGATINKMIGIVAAGCICVRLFVQKKTEIRAKEVLTILFFGLWAFVTSTWSIEVDTTIQFLITLASLLLLFLVTVIRGFSEAELRLIKDAMIFASAVIMIFLAPDVSVSATRLTLKSSANGADHNGLAANILFAMWMAVDRIQQCNGKLGKVLYGTALVSMLASLFFIASRGAFVALVVSALVYFVVCKGKRLKLTTWVLIAGMVALVLVVVGDNSVMLSRLDPAKMLEDGQSGRLMIWDNTLDTIFADIPHLLFGYGYGCEAPISFLSMGERLGIHNIYLELWATMGLVGLVIFLVFLWQLYRKAKVRGDHLAIALLLSFVVVGMFLGFSKDKGAWNALALVCLGCGYERLKFANK